MDIFQLKKTFPAILIGEKKVTCENVILIILIYKARNIDFIKLKLKKINILGHCF